MQGADLPIRSGIRVEVEVMYADMHSRAGQHIFVYYITLENNSTQTVQLLEREWFIQDGLGEPSYLRGEGVVGEQPILEPGQVYRYNSFCPIAHPPGWMEGFYIFQDILGHRFKTPIPRFDLKLSPNRFVGRYTN